MISDSFIALSTLVLAISFFWGYTNMELLFVVLALRSVGTGVQTPTVNAIIPQIIPHNKLMKISGINSTLSSLIMFISPAISGAVLSIASFEIILLVDVFTAIIGVLITSFVIITPYNTNRHNATTHINEIKSGFQYLKQNNYIKRLLIFQLIVLFLISPSAFLTPLLVARTFGDEVWKLSVSQMTYSLGMVLGGLLIATWGGFKKKINTTILAGGVYGLIMAGLSVAPTITVYLIFNTLIGLERPIEQMSGGQRAKVILAKILLEKPDVFLLDEPTNFLDKEHITWLADYLGGVENAFMVVSHDYGFLDKIANRICDIDNDKITKYFGTYSEFLKKKTLLREDYVREFTAQQKEIKKTEEFIRKNRAGRKSKMAKGRQKQLDRMDKIEELVQKEITPFFHFPELPLTDTEHLSVRHLAVGYHYPVLSNIDFRIKGGQKVVITGFNGIGKSTLLKTLVGQIPSIQGDYKFSEQVTLGYFEQDLTWLNEDQTPIQIILDTYPDMVIKDVRKHLAQCGISSKYAMQSIGTLSGGEQAKVKICMLMLRKCNFLIMDEPTNHLDIQAKEALKIALCRFSGTVILVSHEEAFYRGWTHGINLGYALKCNASNAQARI